MASSLPNAAKRPENPRFGVHSDNPNAHTHGLPRPGLRVRAIYDFLPSEPGGLRILKGNIITVLEYSQPQWWKGFLEGRIGLFPTSYVEELSTPSQEDIGTNTDAPVIHISSSSPTAGCEPTNPGLSTAVSKGTLRKASTSLSADISKHSCL
jgi:Variant SH3 domain